MYRALTSWRRTRHRLVDAGAESHIQQVKETRTKKEMTKSSNYSMVFRMLLTRCICEMQPLRSYIFAAILLPSLSPVFAILHIVQVQHVGMPLPVPGNGSRKRGEPLAIVHRRNLLFDPGKQPDLYKSEKAADGHLGVAGPLDILMVPEKRVFLLTDFDSAAAELRRRTCQPLPRKHN